MMISSNDSVKLAFELTYCEWALIYNALLDHKTQLKADIDSHLYPDCMVREFRHELTETCALKDKILFEGKEVRSNVEA